MPIHSCITRQAAQKETLWQCVLADTPNRSERWLMHCVKVQVLRLSWKITRSSYGHSTMRTKEALPTTVFTPRVLCLHLTMKAAKWKMRNKWRWKIQRQRERCISSAMKAIQILSMQSWIRNHPYLSFPNSKTTSLRNALSRRYSFSLRYSLQVYTLTHICLRCVMMKKRSRIL